MALELIHGEPGGGGQFQEGLLRGGGFAAGLGRGGSGRGPAVPGTEDALHEHVLLAPAAVQLEGVADGLKLLALEAAEQPGEVHGARAEEGVGVVLGDAAVGHVEGVVLRELVEAGPPELQEGQTALRWR